MQRINKILKNNLLIITKKGQIRTKEILCLNLIKKFYRFTVIELL